MLGVIQLHFIIYLAVSVYTKVEMATVYIITHNNTRVCYRDWGNTFDKPRYNDETQVTIAMRSPVSRWIKLVRMLYILRESRVWDSKEGVYKARNPM